MVNTSTATLQSSCIIIIPILQMRRLSREIKWLSQSYVAKK